MKPDKVSVYDLFDRQRQYVVPLYQRQYVWDKDTQWEPLWDDIVEKARQVQRGDARAPHFLGAIVTSQQQVFGKQINSWDIIDGQQRLTTLQVVLTAFKDVVTAAKESAYDVDLRRLTRNEGVMGAQTEIFKVWPTNADQLAFRRVMEAGALHPLTHLYPALQKRKIKGVPRLVEAYQFFHEKFHSFVQMTDSEDADGTPSDRIRAVFETFRRHLQIVNIELEADDDPQVIFESLNGRGAPLLPSDLVRNFVFIRAKRKHEDMETLYDRYWRPYDEWLKPTDSLGGKATTSRNGEGDAPWWKQEQRQGRLKRTRLDLFLFHYLQYRQEREVNITHLFQEFRAWWDFHSPSAEASLVDMKANADAFAAWLEPSGHDRVSIFARWLSVLDTSTVYPLLFLVLVEKSGAVTEDERSGILDDLESYLFRRAVCGLTTKQYNRTFLMLLKHLRQSGGVSRQTVRDYLSAGDGDSVRWPTDEEFGLAFVHRPIYKEFYARTVLEALLSLERSMWTVKSERVVDPNLSVEHYMPQSWKAHWPLAESSDSGLERRERLLHSFGNLGLVTPEFNSSLSNREFGVKQSEVRRTSKLLVNGTFTDPGTTSWDEEAIVSRGWELFTLARKRWPHPSSPSVLDRQLFEAPGRWASASISVEGDELSAPAMDVAVARELLDVFAEAAGLTRLAEAE